MQPTRPNTQKRRQTLTRKRLALWITFGSLFGAGFVDNFLKTILPTNREIAQAHLAIQEAANSFNTELQEIYDPSKAVMDKIISQKGKRPTNPDQAREWDLAFFAELVKNPANVQLRPIIIKLMNTYLEEAKKRSTRYQDLVAKRIQNRADTKRAQYFGIGGAVVGATAFAVRSKIRRSKRR